MNGEGFAFFRWRALELLVYVLPEYRDQFNDWPNRSEWEKLQRKPGKAGMRGNGSTTKQMLSAPTGAIFVWCNGHLDYPTHLARLLSRGDLEVVSPDRLTDRRWEGLRLTGIVVDHAACFNDRQKVAMELASLRIRTSSNK